MIRERTELQIEVVGSDDVKKTFEVKRNWDDGRKAILIELYPTITVDKGECWDLTAMHLMNHAKELGWSGMRIVNLYATVFQEKPLARQLSSDVENLSYIEELLESDDIGQYDIVIAWGSSLATHMETINAKIDVLEMLKSKKLIDQVKYITAEDLAANGQAGIHPLYMGLHYSKSVWKLLPYPVETELKALKELIPKNEKKPKKTSSRKGKKADVLQDKE